MGNFYKGNSPTYRSLRENLPEVNKSYIQSTDGFFGEVGKAGVSEIRQIDVDDVISESRKFYDTIAYGGIETKLPKGNGVRTELRDGTIIVYRVITSTPNSPAVEINVRRSNDNCGLKYHKIHFEKKGK
jgi:hypothetical protein